MRCGWGIVGGGVGGSGGVEQALLHLHVCCHPVRSLPLTIGIQMRCTASPPMQVLYNLYSVTGDEAHAECAHHFDKHSW